MSERIQKVLATAGVASRRHIEQWIEEGRIKVNGQPATPGQKVELTDRISVDGKSVRLMHKQEPLRVLLFRKRVGELVTRDDPEGR
ncbi:MAG TPA: S4 domain-containing protein, partial [Stenotrophobium sp.]|nr:S4 domain-containing protein [Stenotrophobium sp.]